jgi:Ca2+-binding RTX toxin-like protein
MSRRTWIEWLHACDRRNQLTRKAKRIKTRLLRLESLGERITPAVNAIFSFGSLSVFGDFHDNTIDISRDAAGKLLVNGGAVTVLGGTATVVNTSQILVFGSDGNDTISLNEANGALPRASLFGGNGNDLLTGGSGSDSLFGQNGNDILRGAAGNDFLSGGANNDTLTGGDGDDQVFGESGNDRLIWNPGDHTDVNEGGTGTDTVEVNGGNGTENFTTTANGTRVRFDRIDPAPFALDIGTSENLVLNANGGDDTYSATGNLAALIQITVDGGAGNDQLSGSNGNDLLIGGDGNDFIDGQQGNDVALMGAGDDIFQWDPGDGSDVVEGQSGADKMIFNGSGANEIVEVSANGTRVRMTRDIGNIVMDLNDVEQVDLRALGGIDKISVNNLGGTGLTQFNVDLGIASVGDAQPDTVIVNGTDGNDNINIFGTGNSVSVVGLAAVVNINNAEGSSDRLVINSLGGNDGVTASTLVSGIIKLFVDGGEGNDSILGSQGADTLFGGDGDDFIDGQQGDDLIDLGAGNDKFQWDPGDGSDIVEGQAGVDLMLFFGSNANENFDISAAGGRVRFFRDVGNITMDLNDVETFEVRTLDGVDNIVVGDLTGSDVTRIDLDLRGSGGTGDGQSDTVTVNGTQGSDVFGVAGDIGGVNIFGLSSIVNIFHQESAIDRLTLNGLGGDDNIDAKSLKADSIQLAINGGLGIDILIGSEGDDFFNGGDGNDLILMGAGDDLFVWNPGDDDDTVEGQSGFDTMVFNGSNVSENITLSANGQRVRLSRNVANVTMDLSEVEGVDLNALGGADVITINDLTGTHLTEINLNLAAFNGGGDGQPDTVFVNGTNGDDVVVVSGDASGTSVVGLAARVNIAGAEASNDRLVINALAGDDVVEASGLSATGIGLTADGGEGDDVLIGGGGNDTLLGGAGDDVLLGGPGVDVLDGGPGDNILIQ